MIDPLKNKWDSDEEFREYAEEYHEFYEFPQSIKNEIHWLAYEKGHSDGYSEVLLCYSGFVEIARKCILHFNGSTQNS